jgi:predicted transcriptional regulator
MSTYRPTEEELKVLKVLWEQQEATVREVNEAINGLQDKHTGYTTTLKIMQLMHGKGLLQRRKDGKSHIYHSLVDEKGTQSQLLDNLMDQVFQGSASKLVLRALGSRRASQKDLEEIREFLEQLEKNQ